MVERSRAANDAHCSATKHACQIRQLASAHCLHAHSQGRCRSSEHGGARPQPRCAQSSAGGGHLTSRAVCGILVVKIDSFVAARNPEYEMRYTNMEGTETIPPAPHEHTRLTVRAVWADGLCDLPLGWPSSGVIGLLSVRRGNDEHE